MIERRETELDLFLRKKKWTLSMQLKATKKTGKACKKPIWELELKDKRGKVLFKKLDNDGELENDFLNLAIPDYDDMRILSILKEFWREEKLKELGL